MTWITKKFGDCAELIRETIVPDQNLDLNYIGLEHISQGGLSLVGIGKSSDVISQKSVFKKGDILFGKLRPYFRKLIIAPFDGVCSTDIWVVRAKSEIDQHFLFYWMATQEFVDNSSQASEGTKMPRAIWEFVSRFEREIPPLPEQRAIAEVLSALDDKIELNRRMNRTLEQLAQALFKHMFVNNSECEKWDVKTLDYVCGFEYGKALKETSRVSGIIPVYGSNGHIGFHNEFLVKGPGIVVGRKGNPGIVTFVHTDFFPIDTTFYVVPKNNSSFYWLFFTLSDLNLPNLGADSAVPGLNRNIAYMSLVAVPPQDLCYEFENLIKPLFEKIQVNNKETQTLAELRDTLLPKLMSGQVRVNPTVTMALDASSSVASE